MSVPHAAFLLALAGLMGFSLHRLGMAGRTRSGHLWLIVNLILVVLMFASDYFF